MEAPPPRVTTSGFPPELAARIRHVTRLRDGTWHVLWIDGATTMVTCDAEGLFWITHAVGAGARPMRVGPLRLTPARPAMFAGRAAAPEDADGVFSPVAGVVRVVLVREGQRVAKGDGAIVVESMKMEITLVAPRDGAVAAVAVSVGAVVERGARLVTLA